MRLTTIASSRSNPSSPPSPGIGTTAGYPMISPCLCLGMPDSSFKVIAGNRHMIYIISRKSLLVHSVVIIREPTRHVSVSHLQNRPCTCNLVVLI